jgi:hypothetical protein
MSDALLAIFSKAVFGGSILLILYIVYREWKLNKIKAEQDEIALGEKENEDIVANLSDPDLVATINSEFSKLPTPPSKPDTKKPTS